MKALTCIERVMKYSIKCLCSIILYYIILSNRPNLRFGCKHKIFFMLEYRLKGRYNF